MTGKKFRVLLAEGHPGEAAESLRVLYPGPGSALELSVVSRLSTLLADDRACRTGNHLSRSLSWTPDR